MLNWIEFAGMGLMSEAFSQTLIPVCALIGILFALVQWFLVSRIRVASSGPDSYEDQLIEEDDEQVEGIDSAEVVNKKCAEIQNAISVGKTSPCLSLFLSVHTVGYLCFFLSSSYLL